MVYLLYPKHVHVIALILIHTLIILLEFRDIVFIYLFYSYYKLICDITLTSVIFGALIILWYGIILFLYTYTFIFIHLQIFPNDFFILISFY